VSLTSNSIYKKIRLFWCILRQHFINYVNYSRVVRKLLMIFWKIAGKMILFLANGFKWKKIFNHELFQWKWYRRGINHIFFFAFISCMLHANTTVSSKFNFLSLNNANYSNAHKIARRFAGLFTWALKFHLLQAKSNYLCKDFLAQ
jgi:hypothetical protein